MSTTLVCRVQRRLPVALVALYGTLDQTSAARAMVTLRDCLADAPTALLLDVSHLSIGSRAALAPVISLAAEAWIWPGARVGVCAASEATAALVRGFDAVNGPDLYPDVERALESALRIPVVPRLALSLRPVFDAPAQSRQFVNRTCTDWAIARVAVLAELVVSELVTNAVVHARTPLIVTLRHANSCLQVSVRDLDPRPMHRPEPGTQGTRDGEHGRGLLLLEAMTDGWGCNPTVDGKVVWAKISVPPLVGVASPR